MPEEVTVVVASEQIDVLAPPAEMRISVGVGAPGKRGSRFYAGTASPAAFYAAIGESPYVYDLYINTASNQVSQYVSTPSGNIWSLLFDLKTIYEKAVFDAASSTIVAATWSGATTLPVTYPAMFSVSLTNNTALTVPTPAVGTASFSIGLVVTQTAGSKTLTFTGVKWPNGMAPTMSPTAAAIDVYFLTWTGTVWLGSVGGQAYA